MKWYLYQYSNIYPDGNEYQVFNVVPEIGINHDPHPSCWCHPSTELYPDNKIIISHEVMH